MSVGYDATDRCTPPALRIISDMSAHRYLRQSISCCPACTSSNLLDRLHKLVTAWSRGRAPGSALQVP
jgi:hypothetical protein